MKTVEVTAEYGIIVRRSSADRIGIPAESICSLLEQEAPLDANENILSFGPSFGGEAADEFIRRLELAGLTYIDDFFVFHGDFPDWCRFFAGAVDGK